ncbi:hypothetical protein CVT26_003916 [Gymnopilus dilepis]|uniref:Kri1-like C-terminal domain-containing protein n=1 Tax=Gymnopilus dilepis TaxID=231916 RepID=A0A409YUS0_9AGAR|nr:hypothetical protein CVT26_003916 [Gymnopilus dilepis]
MAEPTKLELFSDDEGSSDGKEVLLTINEHYAKAFEHRKEREELQRLKDKYGSDYDPDASDSDVSTDSESAESEDEHGEELTPAVDAAILRTLARIKKKDPSIYDSNKNIFGEESEKLAAKAPKLSDGKEKSKDKTKPITIRQANLQAMLTGSRSPSPEPDANKPLTHAEEQEALRRETIAAFHAAVGDDGEGDDFLLPREKTQDEREKEEEEYRAFLEREVGDLKELVSVDDLNDGQEEQKVEAAKEEGEEDAGSKKKNKKKSKKNADAPDAGSSKKKSKAEEDQEFLLNYIMNRGWIDRSKGHVPTYNEVTSPADERRKKKGKAKADPEEEEAASDASAGEDDEEMDTGMLSDASFDSVASYFEASYNHRFEEPGADTIPTYPRNLPSLVRRPDTTRKEARERRKQRKEEEMQKKREEVNRLKALKMREVKRKLEMISRQAGLKTKKPEAEGEDEDEFVDDALKELDLEGEWDPEKHDRQMSNIFERDADAFEEEAAYEEDDGVKFDKDGKPVWDDDIDIGDIPISDDEYPGDSRPSKKDKKKKKKKKKGGEDDEAGVDIDAMDADVEPTPEELEEWDGSEEMRKRVFNKYMDEIYGLEFNDMVGDLPTRFKYVPVPAQDFALTPAEILMATDQELNEYTSLKKYAPYRLDKDSKHKYHKKTQEKLWELKAKIAERSKQMYGVDIGGTGSNAIGVQSRGGDEEAPKKRRKGKKERMKLKAAKAAEGAEDDDEADGDVDMLEAPSTAAAVVDNAQSKESKKSKKRKREHESDSRKDQSRVEDSDSADSDAAHVNGNKAGEGEEGAAKKKRKRRHKKRVPDGEGASVVAAQA